MVLPSTDVKPYNNHCCALGQAMIVGHKDVVEYLRQRGVSICGSEGAVVLSRSCKEGMLEVVKELVEVYNVNPKGTPCSQAHVMDNVSNYIVATSLTRSVNIPGWCINCCCMSTYIWLSSW